MGGVCFVRGHDGRRNVHKVNRNVDEENRWQG